MTFQTYEQALQHVLTAGHERGDRTGTGTLSCFGLQMRFDLEGGFPLITSKKVHFKSVVAELLWFLSGSTNVKDLQALGCTIWDEWADPDTGDLGPIYGHQWRSWATPDGSTIDQITNVIRSIQNDPTGRRHIVSAWNVADIPDMALPPCHCLFQFYVQDGKLSCQLYQRSADMFLGVPFNIASYALLTHMVADQCGLGVGEFIWTGGDCHIYLNHIEQVQEQLSRSSSPYPELVMAGLRPNDIFSYGPGCIQLEGYDPHPAIKAPVAV